MAGGPIFVTGAGGFIGRWLVELLRRNGHQVRALFRRVPEQAVDGSVEVVIGDLVKPETYSAALAGATAVVHAALTGGLTEDVQATNRLHDRSVQAGIRKFIHLSSIAVYGNPLEGVITEETPPRELRDTYSRTKLEIEKSLRATSGVGETVILRLGCVYGPGNGWWTTGLLNMMRRGKLIAVDGGSGTANLIHVDDVAAIVMLLLARSNAAIETFNVTDGMPVPWRSYFSELEKILGRPATVSMSVAEAQEYGKAWLRPSLARRVMRKMRGTAFVHPLDQAGIETYRSQAEYSNAKAAKILGFKPAFDLVRGMKTVEAALPR